ncbi:hypothetical protein CMV_005185 [Castanea mollissima]|uniref:Uncharacterized protein n=1 Tax=Castanea mollissima TaxID=60419 RepID=A0A8J4VUR6_9ROSI|nr:hypothetical protein CMV_005185 [Castanea mollissima]
MASSIFINVQSISPWVKTEVKKVSGLRSHTLRLCRGLISLNTLLPVHGAKLPLMIKACPFWKLFAILVTVLIEESCLGLCRSVGLELGWTPFGSAMDHRFIALGHTHWDGPGFVSAHSGLRATLV